MKLKEFYYVILFMGVMSMFSMTLLMAGTFYTAYKNESKTVIVDINHFGEADIEAWIVVPYSVLISLFAVIGTFVMIGRSLSHEIKNRRMGEKHENP